MAAAAGPTLPRPSSTPLVLLLSFLCLTSSSLSGDLESLLSVKTALQNPNTNVFTNWLSTNSICNFTAITCNSGGSVSEIDLSHQGLSGSVPFAPICSLPALEKLSLGFNSLSGPVPEEINRCSGLKYLDLGNNLFSGSVPDISALSGLTHLYMNLSRFSGTFPWNSVTNMSGLAVLSVGDNPFDRTPFPEQVLNLNKLTWLYLSNCSIEGKIPEGIGNLTELMNLELSENYLTGEIPATITKLRNLWQLELYRNELTGKLPVGLRNLTNLEFFDASTNYLYGDLSEVGYLENLVSLQLFENEFSGEFPPAIGEFKKLVNVSLYTNKLTGQLPQKIGSWADFNFIDVSENFLTGPIPPDMCKKGTMKQLLILQNNFTGGIPESYGSCLSLTRLRVSRNSLSGEVPRGLWGLPELSFIDIEDNGFEGWITPEIGNAKSLTEISLANNKLSGALPWEITQATALSSVDLSNNQFSGELPESIGELSQLNRLHLQNNRFSGSIPDSLGSCKYLSIISMAHNSLTGLIPGSLGSVSVLNSLNLSNNQLSGHIPRSLSSLRLSLLDLSSNQLTGPIPESLSIAAYNGSFTGNNGLCSENIASFKRCSPRSGGLSRKLRVVVVCLMVASIISLVPLAFFLYSKRNKNFAERKRSLKDDSWNVKSFHVLSFTEDDILDGIKEENLIGKGGSGNVYRVLLANGIELAVKHIWNFDSNGQKKAISSTPMLGKRGVRSKEFEAEVRTLSSIRHVNVVKLYCSITSEDSSLLVYEFSTNGSLWDRLHSCKKLGLDWDTRYEIALGAAKGLEYLHHGCDRPVIHRDVKSSNILLDEALKPRIADFGLARMAQEDASKDSTHVVAGTHGYIAPEYGYTRKVTVKSDVYSFGVVLMELVTGKRPIEAEFGENKDIVTWVSSNLKSQESVLGMVDSDIPEAFKEDAINVLRIAILCTDRVPTMRPSMRNVVQMLEDAEPCKLVGIIVKKDSFKENKA